MKNLLFTLGAGLLLTSCAGVRVSETQTAAVVTEKPVAIYIRPFSVDGAEFTGYHSGGRGERPLRQSHAPAEFSIALKEELEKLAPARVLAPDEVATTGWLVTGSIDRVDAGDAPARAFFPGGHPIARTHVAMHVKVIDLSHRGVAVEAKDEKATGSLHRHGQVIYEFDVKGGSRWSGKYGTVASPGLGNSVMFDYRNAADRVREALENDPHRYGDRGSTLIN
jgi:hypothetical protein